MNEYAKQAKERWGNTKEYREFEEKTANKTPSEIRDAGNRLMDIVAGFGKLRDRDVSDPLVQAQVKALQDFITENYYTCTNDILSGLGKMYACGGEFTRNIDRAGGEGAAAFANEAIQCFCGKQ